jgi:hypothetical protein
MARSRPDLLAGLFLVMYAAFAAANGLNQLVLATLQGKLIAAGNRGHAMVVSVTVGSVLAILAAVLLFMALYYRVSGLVADVALVLNGLLVLAIMSMIGTTSKGSTMSAVKPNFSLHRGLSFSSFSAM